ncbi:MAG TPA: PilZ domain-containing protein [Candidatus Dormibacteraeota bacterium]|nr:PilZ domain-containing protein [Candidatus Dormibacteraeota bacterium]
MWEAIREAERHRSRSNNSADQRGLTFDVWERRGKSRHSHTVALLVYGSDAEKQPFHEEATTIDVNERGCLIDLETVVARGQRLFLTNTVNQAEQECRVVHVARRSHGKARIGIEFVRPSPHFWRPA